MIRLAVLASIATPTSALAHAGTHAHPHGTAWIALVAVVAAFIGYRMLHRA